jgi:hypothetical protein
VTPPTIGTVFRGSRARARSRAKYHADSKLTRALKTGQKSRVGDETGQVRCRLRAHGGKESLGREIINECVNALWE